MVKIDDMETTIDSTVLVDENKLAINLSAVYKKTMRLQYHTAMAMLFQLIRKAW